MASKRPLLIACTVIVILVSFWSYFTTLRFQMTMSESNLPYYRFDRPKHREVVTLSGSNLSYNNFDRPKHKEWVTLSESNLSYYNFDRPKNREWVRLPELNLSIYSFDKPKNREWVEDEVMRVVAAVHRRNFTPPANETCRSRAPVAVLIGVSKCGTREILEFLHLHPHVELYQPTKAPMEMPYFMYNNSYKKGDEWFVSQMPCSYSNQVTVMKNSAYFNSPILTAERIRSFNSSIKLILIVREPVSRTISRFKFEVQHGKYKSGSALEDFVFQNNTINERNICVKNSVYDKNMKNWLKYFRREQFLVIDSDEFKFYPARALRRVEEFLGLRPFFTPELFVWNEQKGFYCLKTNLSETGMACYSQIRGKQAMDVNPQTRRILTEYFRPSVQRFFKISGCSFDWGY